MQDQERKLLIEFAQGRIKTLRKRYRAGTITLQEFQLAAIQLDLMQGFINQVAASMEEVG